MTDNRKASVALIAGSVGIIITMVFHPHGKIAPERVEQMVRMLIAMHTLALLSIPVILLGLWGVSRWLATPDRISWAALLLYAIGSIAVMNAAVLDGLVAPVLIRKIVSATPETREMTRMFMDYNFQLNQAFARVYAVGSSLALLLWSVSILRKRTAGSANGIYGCILGVVTAGGIFSGYLSPSWHGFGMLVFGQAIWFLAVAKEMWSQQEVATLTPAQ